MRIVRYLKEFGLSIKELGETIQNEAKEQEGGFLSISLGTLGASLLGNLLTGKAVKQSLKWTKSNENRRVKLEQVRILNVVSSFNYFWNPKVLLTQT